MYSRSDVTERDTLRSYSFRHIVIITERVSLVFNWGNPANGSFGLIPISTMDGA
jgi:hypothetical protein